MVSRSNGETVSFRYASRMPNDEASVKIGISQCLLGDAVRYDGADKRSTLAVDLLGEVFAFVPVCPEVEAGMGVPREPVKLQDSGGRTAVVGTESGTDHTETMARFVVRKIEDLAGANLRGFILKSGSPSCGLEVAVEGSGTTQPGLFARALEESFPDLPKIEETAMRDAAARQGFVERVFAYDRQMRFLVKERSVGQLVMAHAQAKLQLDVHSPDAHAEISAVFKKAADLSYQEVTAQYLTGFMAALQTPATPASHFAVMKTVFEGLKGSVEPGVQKELARALQEYRQGSVPLSVPLTLLRHYVRVQEHPRFNQQTYLEPEPRELILRTRV